MSLRTWVKCFAHIPGLEAAYILSTVRQSIRNIESYLTKDSLHDLFRAPCISIMRPFCRPGAHVLTSVSILRRGLLILAPLPLSLFRVHL
jgi:hypothetical protein